MKNIIGIRREDPDKKGEKRVAITPQMVGKLVQDGAKVLVQPERDPETGEHKRAFYDRAYQKQQAEVTEDLEAAKVIFGLKEVAPDEIQSAKTYLFFSHTHKGQIKNRELLRSLVKKKTTLIDYELIVDETGQRLLTAFTYFAGYAGMVDTMWALGKRLTLKEIDHPFARLPQSIERENLAVIRELVKAVGLAIEKKGTPAEMPPLISCFLGNGKTSTGAQEIYDLLPSVDIRLQDLPRVFAEGDRRKVYKLVLDVPEMYRVKADSVHFGKKLTDQEFFDLYLAEPEHFETNLNQVFPYCTMWLNCIIWSPRFPRLLSREQTKAWYEQYQTLEVIGDITCDPEGAIHFSKETWIDQPVFIYDPFAQTRTYGFTGEGIAVMAVTNLPCEFSADASAQFGSELEALLPGIMTADFEAEHPSTSGLPEPIQKAVILWKGEFTQDFGYMKEYLRS